MRKKTFFQQLKKNREHDGIKYLIGSGLAFSLMSVCVKAISERIPIYELVFARAFISIIITRYLLFKNNI